MAINWRATSVYISSSNPLMEADQAALLSGNDTIIVEEDMKSKNFRVISVKGRSLLKHSLQSDYVSTASVESTHYSTIPHRGDVLDIYVFKTRIPKLQCVIVDRPQLRL